MRSVLSRVGCGVGGVSGVGYGVGGVRVVCCLVWDMCGLWCRWCVVWCGLMRSVVCLVCGICLGYEVGGVVWCRICVGGVVWCRMPHLCCGSLQNTFTICLKVREDAAKGVVRVSALREVHVRDASHVLQLLKRYATAPCMPADRDKRTQSIRSRALVLLWWP